MAVGPAVGQIISLVKYFSSCWGQEKYFLVLDAQIPFHLHQE